MINGYSAGQVRATEAPYLAAGVPLMQRAAAGLAQEIARLLPEGGGRVLLLVGTGNNGADALYAGAELAERGSDVAIVLTGDRARAAGSAAQMGQSGHSGPPRAPGMSEPAPVAPSPHEQALAGAQSAGAYLVDAQEVAALTASADVVVDGILGTGTSANPALRGKAREIVEAILSVVTVPGHPLVVAVDIPSGINPDDGSVPDPVVLPADLTVTFGGYKAGLLIPPASELAGRLTLVDIGLGPDLARLEPLIRVPEPSD